MMGMGWQELAIIFVIVLIIFGPKSLPKIGQALGRGIREFKDAAKGLTSDMDDDDEKPRPAKTSTPLMTQSQTEATASEKTTEHHV